MMSQLASSLQNNSLQNSPLSQFIQPRSIPSSLLRFVSLSFIFAPIIQFVQAWLDAIEVTDLDNARLLCRLIPGQCPFERTIVLFGRTVAHIPPLCKLNPFFEQLVGLRFRALCFIADRPSEVSSKGSI